MYRLLITFSNSYAGGGAVCTTTLVPFDTQEEADEVYTQIDRGLHYSILKLYLKDKQYDTGDV